MTKNRIQKTTVVSAASGAWRVEIAIADTADTARARDVMTLIAVVQGSENPTLSDLQRAALNRARVLIDESTAALAPAESSS